MAVQRGCTFLSKRLRGSRLLALSVHWREFRETSFEEICTTEYKLERGHLNSHAVLLRDI